jgi:4-hydroxy-tetrahydrodipicolinate synthase
MLYLRGVFAPIVTPFRLADGEVDVPWIRDYLQYLRSHGCEGIVPCGTNGEAPSLSVEERQQVVAAALSAADGMPVIAGTGASALPDAIALTRHAFWAGVDAVLIMPPFYYRRPADAGVAAWYQRLFDAAVPPGGRVLLYHIPQTTGVPISDELIRALLINHREIVCGIKDSTGDPLQGKHFRETFPGLCYFAGNDHRVVSVLDAFPLQPATKAALAEIAGLPPTGVRPPQIELTTAQRAELRTALQTVCSC